MSAIDLDAIRRGDALLERARRQLRGRTPRPVPIEEIDPMTEEKAAYTTEEISELLTVNIQTVRRWIRDGDLAAIKVGQGYRVDRPALERFWRARGGTALFSSTPAPTTAAVGPPTIFESDIADFFSTWGDPGLSHYSANVRAGFISWAWDARDETAEAIRGGDRAGLVDDIAYTVTQADQWRGEKAGAMRAARAFLDTWGAELADALEQSLND